MHLSHLPKNATYNPYDNTVEILEYKNVLYHRYYDGNWYESLDDAVAQYVLSLPELVERMELGQTIRVFDADMPHIGRLSIESRKDNFKELLYRFERECIITKIPLEQYETQGYKI